MPFSLAYLWYRQTYPAVETINSLPDSPTLILFSGSLQTSPYNEKGGLFVADIEAGTISEWVWQSGVFSIGLFTWMPKQEILSFEARLEEDTGATFFTLSPEGQFIPILFWSPFETDKEHTWSPDATILAYSKNEELLLLELEGQVEHTLVDVPGSEGFPAWSPDGTEIVFQSLHSGDYDLYRLTPSGTNLASLTQDIGGNSRAPRWSPDGSKVAFLHAVAGVDLPYGLWVMNRDGSDAKPVFVPPNPATEAQAAGVVTFDWSPDGQQLIFISGHVGPCRSWSMDARFTECTEKVYIVNADGTGLTTLDIQPKIDYSDVAWVR